MNSSYLSSNFDLRTRTQNRVGLWDLHITIRQNICDTRKAVAVVHLSCHTARLGVH